MLDGNQKEKISDITQDIVKVLLEHGNAYTEESAVTDTALAIMLVLNKHNLFINL